MPLFEFSTVIDAVRLPGSQCTGNHFQLRWFLNDDNKGESPTVPRHGDEVSFIHTAKFIIDTKGIISHLLQISVVEVLPVSGDTNLVGLLMIDLNAHVPKPPQKSSKQRATLNMSRCPFTTPAIMRLLVECNPTDVNALTSPPQPTTAAGSSSSASPSRNALSAGGILPNSNQTGGGGAQQRSGSFSSQSAPLDPAEVRTQMIKLRSAVSTLSASNDQLRDENTLLRRGLQQARNEPDYVYGGGGGGNRTTNNNQNNNDTFLGLNTDAGGGGSTPSASPIPRAPIHNEMINALEEENNSLRKEMETMRAETAVLQRGLSNAKEQLRTLIQKDEDSRKEINSLNRSNSFLMAETERLQREVEQANAAHTKESEGELASLREMLAASQQMNRDLRVMVHSAETLADSVKQELLAARKDADVADKRRLEALELCDKRQDEHRARSERAEAAVRLGQAELERLHAYATELHDKYVALVAELKSEREDHRRSCKKLRDLRAIIIARAKVEDVEAHKRESTASQNSKRRTERAAQREAAHLQPEVELATI